MEALLGIAFWIALAVWAHRSAEKRRREKEAAEERFQVEADRAARRLGYMDAAHQERVAHDLWRRRNGIVDYSNPTRKTDT